MTTDIKDLIKMSMEVKTPLDNRTNERKSLTNKSMEVNKCSIESEYGFFTYLRFKDIDFVISCLNNLN